MKKVKDSYNELKKDAEIFEKNNKPDYHKYLQKVYKEMKKKILEYGYEMNDENNNLDFINYNNNPNNNNANNNIINNMYIYSPVPENNNNNNMAVQVHLNQVDSQTNRQQLTINTTQNTNDRYKKVKENIEVKKEDLKTSKNIKKFKKAVRRINKLKKLYHEIDKETKEDLNRFRMKKKCTCGFVILFLAFSIVLISDILLPITFGSDEDYTKSAEGNEVRFSSILELVLGIILIYPFSVIVSSYTLIMIYSTIRKNYISGDYLYDKQINDNISLLKTVKIICGYSFSILYCNLYFWRSIDTYAHYGKPNFYDTTFIPDYSLKRITIFMIIKIIVIAVSMIGCQYLSSCDFFNFKNDLGEFNRNDSGHYNQFELNRIFQEKGLVASFLYRQ